MSIDIALLNALNNGKKWALCVWEPYNTLAVIGRGGDIQKEIHKNLCKKDSVKIYRRRTGGGAVILTPGVLVFSLAKKVKYSMAIKNYTKKINNIVISFLESKGIKQVKEKGISDICINDKKILGSGLYMGKDNLFFQGSLLVNPNMETIYRYLPHPPREPVYRKKRKHQNFITSLQQEGYKYSAKELSPIFLEYLSKYITILQ